MLLRSPDPERHPPHQLDREELKYLEKTQDLFALARINWTGRN